MDPDNIVFTVYTFFDLAQQALVLLQNHNGFSFLRLCPPATTAGHLYKYFCRSVGPTVRPSVYQ